MSRTIVDVHVLQTVPPSNLNRDDTGSPKTATYGGVRRARVSSQAWKRATRNVFAEYLDDADLGVRTKQVVELLGQRITALSPELDTQAAEKAAAQTLEAAGIKVKEPSKGATPESGYLLFLSALQIESLARLSAESAGGKPDPREAKALIKGKNSIDLSLFGRMVADVTDLNVDAACQVAHALSTHQVDTEYDYFTAVDDHKAADPSEDAGAGMIGTVEFNSATLYRYATIDVNRLLDNLGDAEAADRAVGAFLKAFIRSMPTGKQNTFANRTLPDAVMIAVRDDQPISFVGAFEEPVRDTLEGGRVRRSIERLSEHAQAVAQAYGGEPIQAWVVGVGSSAETLGALGERVGLDDAIRGATALVRDRLLGA